MLAERMGDDGIKYCGQWLHSMYQGSGVMEWSSSENYQGDWMGGKRNGMGVQCLADGQRYEGAWSDNKRHGMCVEVLADRNKFHGEYQCDERVRGVFTWADDCKALCTFAVGGVEILSARNKGLDVLMHVLNMPLDVPKVA